MSRPPRDEGPARLSDLGEAGPPRLVDTPVWVRPLGAVLTVALVVITILAAIGANPW